MKMTALRSLAAFVADHWLTALFVVLLGALYTWLDKGAELGYAAWRFSVVVLISFAAVRLVFRHTLRPYIETALAQDFNGLDARSKVWMTFAVIGFILFIATECFCHAASPEATLAGARERMQETRWEAAVIRKEKVHFVEATALQIGRNKARYLAVERETGVPWRIIASLHNMECSLSFREHLHNGDSLAGRTRNAPRGRPAFGHPPFAWQASAVDALNYDHLPARDWSGIGATLQNVESYNGTGYERRGAASPYLWSWTNLYERGKYVADNKWDPLAVSRQCGVVPLLKLLGN